MGKQAKKAGRRRQDERRRRDTRRARAERLLEVLAGLGDPLAVVHALTSSPMGLHRHLTLGPAVEVALRAAGAGRGHGVVDGGVSEVLALLEGQTFALARMEDARPRDPRLPAVGRFGGQVYRLYPGMLERPVAAVRRAELVAIAIDRSLISHFGFGMGDFISVCLTHTDRAVGLLAPAWPDGDIPMIGTPPPVTAAEVAAAGGVVEWLGLDAPHLHPERARAALEWATVSPADLRAHTRQDLVDTCFGTAVAAAAADGRRLALPLPYIAEAWERATGVLAESAMRKEPAAAARWLNLARRETTRLLDRIRDMPPLHLVHSPAGPALLVPFGERHVLAVGVAATLGRDCDTDAAGQAVAAVRPGARLTTASGPLVVPRDAEVVRLVVAAPASAARIGLRTRAAMLTLDDLSRVSDTCKYADELFAFCRDLQRPPGGTELLGWDKVDAWEVWRSNGQALHHAGQAPTAIYVAPHQAGGEWDEAAGRARIEHALHRLGLPPAAALAGFDESGDKVMALTSEMELWHLALLEGSVIAATGTEPVPEDLRALAADVPGTLCWAIMHVREATAAALQAVGRDALVARLDFADDAGDPLRLTDTTDDGTLHIAWTAQLPEAEIVDPGWIQRRLGELLCGGLRRLAKDEADLDPVDRLAAQWSSAPPVFALSQGPLVQRAQHLHQPRPTPDWARSRVRRQFAEHIRATGEPPGLHRGAAAMDFETKIVAPWLMKRMRSALTAFSSAAILKRAGTELEAVTACRKQARQDRWRHRHMWRTPNIDDNLSERDGEMAAQRATLAAVLEVTLATEPSGTRTPDDIEWSTLLALGALYVEATIRSDALRWNIDGDATEISDSYEVTRVAADTPVLDMVAFNDARRRHSRLATTATTDSPNPGTDDDERVDRRHQGHDADEAADQHNADGQTRSLADIDPTLAGIDDAMRTDLGCTVHAILATCVLLTQWPVTDDRPIATVSTQDLVQQIAGEFDIDTSEAAAAVEALSLRGANLAAEGVQPWKGRARDHRLMTRPVIQLGDGTVMLLPWNADMTGEVLTQYVFDGLLPWAPRRLEGLPHVRRALDQVRLRRTRVLEDETHRRLQTLGLRVQSRVKPHDAHVLGLGSLPGEIDHVAAHPNDDILWVIDDKDLAEVYTPAEIARSVANFHGPRGEINKLLGKVAAVAADVPAVMAALRMDTRPRTVKGLFVTRTPAAAAFVAPSAVPFVVLENLPNVVAPNPPSRPTA
ncbi:hypothetical protein [Phytohabitans suffuscus]|uniref:hypothetical protein n=1 Tax=Phytohabitans suffuscus TaxID=624315 RepID=UPI0015664885|nr:hypothetical protein [Phytohabitans suffuscus]